MGTVDVQHRQVALHLVVGGVAERADVAHPLGDTGRGEVERGGVGLAAEGIEQMSGAARAGFAAVPETHGHAALLARVGDVGEGGQVPADVHDNENRGWWRSHAAYRLPLTLISGAFFVSLMAFYFLTSWVPKLLVDGGLSQGQAVTAGALLTSGGIIAAFGLGWLSLKRSIIPIVASVTALSAAFTLLFGQLPSEVAWVLPAAFLLGLATNATQIGLYAIVPSLFPAQIRAGATGIAIGIGRTGSVVGPWLAGVLLSAGWSVAGLFAVMALPYLVGVFILLGLRDWQRH
jgi:predicted MFS family arabinose efflux permease